MLVSATLTGCGGPSAEELAAVDYAPLVLDDWAVSTPEEQELDPALVAGLYYKRGAIGDPLRLAGDQQ